MRDRRPNARHLATKRGRVTGVLLDRVEEQPCQGPLAHGRNRTTKLTGWLVTGVPMARRAPAVTTTLSGRGPAISRTFTVATPAGVVLTVCIVASACAVRSEEHTSELQSLA